MCTGYAVCTLLCPASFTGRNGIETPCLAAWISSSFSGEYFSRHFSLATAPDSACVSPSPSLSSLTWVPVMASFHPSCSLTAPFPAAAKVNFARSTLDRDHLVLTCISGFAGHRGPDQPASGLAFTVPSKIIFRPTLPCCFLHSSYTGLPLDYPFFSLNRQSPSQHRPLPTPSMVSSL